MLRPRLLRISPSKILRRNLHVPPPLEQFQNGIPDFLSNTAIDISWNQYQASMVHRLNNIIKGKSASAISHCYSITQFMHDLLTHLSLGSTDENLSTKSLLIKYAREPDQAATFNYASMAHNNNFFFESLASEKIQIPAPFKKSLKTSWSSIETLRKEFVATVDAMFGPGFVWLVARKSSAVQSKPSDFALLTTYLAGSPYPGAHYRRQQTDMNTQNADPRTQHQLLNSEPTNSVGAMGRHSESAKKKELLGGFHTEDNLIPLLCINTWEHVWLPDYSIMGKREYAQRWWERVDWNKVYQRHTEIS